MNITRETIISNYRKLEQLEEYEDLIELLIGKSNKHWWKIVLPKCGANGGEILQEFAISGDDSRASFMNFIESEIKRLKKDLGIRD